MIAAKCGKPRLLPSKAYTQYEKDAGYFLAHKREYINIPVNVKCVYYMPTRRRVDLTNLLSATDDVLVHYGVLADDNRDIIAGHDGSAVLLDKDNPRTEITITRVSNYEQWSENSTK
jgi:Holliday junction resolvase RusA-like endonuclease